MQIPNSAVLAILILASIGLSRVAFWLGSRGRRVWDWLSKKGGSYSLVQFKPSDDQELSLGFQDDADNLRNDADRIRRDWMDDPRNL